MPESYLETITKYFEKAPVGSYLSLKLLEGQAGMETAPEFSNIFLVACRKKFFPLMNVPWNAPADSNGNMAADTGMNFNFINRKSGKSRFAGEKVGSGSRSRIFTCSKTVGKHTCTGHGCWLDDCLSEKVKTTISE
ncbi:MAG: hypothetical protein K9H14_06365 [Actinomycetia bacterium]|nr:hypothetical protein [Actinomycetes bacterium]